MTCNLSLPTYTKHCGFSQLGGPVAGIYSALRVDIQTDIFLPEESGLSYYYGKVGGEATWRRAVWSNRAVWVRGSHIWAGKTSLGLEGQAPRCAKNPKVFAPVPQKGQSFPRPWGPCPLELGAIMALAS